MKISGRKRVEVRGADVVEEVGGREAYVVMLWMVYVVCGRIYVVLMRQTPKRKGGTTKATRDKGPIKVPLSSDFFKGTLCRSLRERKGRMER